MEDKKEIDYELADIIIAIENNSVDDKEFELFNFRGNHNKKEIKYGFNSGLSISISKPEKTYEQLLQESVTSPFEIKRLILKAKTKKQAIRPMFWWGILSNTKESWFTNVPIILADGWNGCFVDFIGEIPLLIDENSGLSFHKITAGEKIELFIYKK